MMTIPNRGRLGAAAGTATMALLALSVAACDTFDRLLAVRAPTQVLADELDDPMHAEFLLNSMISTFDCALGAYVLTSGEISDVLYNTTNQVARSRYDARDLDAGFGHIANYGTGDCNAAQNVGIYTPIQRARWYADDLLNNLENRWDADAVGPNRDRYVATAAAYAGYSTILLGEGFCTATFDGGPEVTRADAFGRAADRFTRAISAGQAAGAADIVNMASVGLARALHNLGDLQAAANVARQVPAGFVYATTHESAPTYRNNIVAWQTGQLLQGSVNEAWRAPEWQGVPDPRVGATQVTAPAERWIQTKYPTVTSPIPVARYEEAQLIIAEAELEVGNHEETVRIINALHDAAGLPPFESNDPVEIREHLIRERGHELFLEGHRLADMLRYDIPFYPETGLPYEGTGGGIYNTTTCVPLPPVEYNNNPNIHR